MKGNSLGSVLDCATVCIAPSCTWVRHPFTSPVMRVMARCLAQYGGNIDVRSSGVYVLIGLLVEVLGWRNWGRVCSCESERMRETSDDVLLPQVWEEDCPSIYRLPCCLSVLPSTPTVPLSSVSCSHCLKACFFLFSSSFRSLVIQGLLLGKQHTILTGIMESLQK